jgi:hypothetical protein
MSLANIYILAAFRALAILFFLARSAGYRQNVKAQAGLLAKSAGRSPGCGIAFDGASGST